MENLILKTRTLEHVKTFWEKSRDRELRKLFPFTNSTIEEAIQLFEETLKPNAKSFGKVIYIGYRYIGDVWCYGIDEANEKSAFLSIVIFDKTYWGMGVGKLALQEFCQLVFNNYNIDKLCAFTYNENVRSMKTLEGVGFQKLEEFEEEGIASSYFELARGSSV